MSLKTEGLDNYGRIMKSGYDEESFRNLEAVLAQAKAESLQQQSSGRIDRRGSLKKGGMVGGGGGGSMIESFRNLDAALRQAEQNSLSELSYNHTDTSNTTSQLYEAINGLDDDTARAIQQSLNNDTDKNMFESFRNLSGELGQAKHNSLSDMGQEFESFRNLDEAMAMAMKMSLDDQKKEQKKIMEKVQEEEDSDSCSESSKSSSSESMDLHEALSSSRDKKGDITKSTFHTRANNSSGRVVHVNEAAPDLERLAHRHANRRFEENRRGAGEGESTPSSRRRSSRARETTRRLSASMSEMPDAPTAASSVGHNTFTASCAVANDKEGGDVNGEKPPRKSSINRRRSSSERIGNIGHSFTAALGAAATSGRDVVRRSSSTSSNITDEDKAKAASASSVHYSSGRRTSALLGEQMKDELTPKERRKKKSSSSKKKGLFGGIGKKK